MCCRGLCFAFIKRWKYTGWVTKVGHCYFYNNSGKCRPIFRRTLLRYVTFALCHRKSACPLSVCLSSVCLSRWCTPLRVEHFGDVFAPSNRLATRTACAKLLERNLKGLCDVIVQESGMKNQRFPTNISHFILETIQGTAVVTMEEMNRTNSYAIC